MPQLNIEGTMDRIASTYSRLKASSLSLASGILLSASVNILSSLAVADSLGTRWRILTGAAVSFFAAAIFLYLLSVALDEAHRLWAITDHEPNAWGAIVSPRRKRMTWLLSLGAGLTLCSLILLFVAVIGR